MGKDLSGFAHQEDWEVIRLLIMLLDIIHDKAKSFLILFVHNRFLTISWNIEAIYLIENHFNILMLIQIGNWDDPHTRLLQKLYMCFWDVWNELVSGIQNILIWLLWSDLNIFDVVEVTAGVEIITNTM